MNESEKSQAAIDLCYRLLPLRDDVEAKGRVINDLLLNLEHLDAFDILATALCESTALAQATLDISSTDHELRDRIDAELAQWNDNRFRKWTDDEFRKIVNSESFPDDPA